MISLPREDQQSFRCTYTSCTEEAAWYVWYANNPIYTYLCHDHLIEQLKGVQCSIIQVSRTARWMPHTPEEIDHELLRSQS